MPTATPTGPADNEGQRLLRLLAAIASFAAFILVIACLYWGRLVLIPVALALFFTFLLEPVVDFFQRVGLNRMLAILLVVLCAGIFFTGIGWAVMGQVSRLAHDLRYNVQYKQNIKHKFADLRRVNQGGLLEDFQAAVDEIMGEVAPDVPPAEQTAEAQVIVQEESSALTTLQETLDPLLEPLATAALVVVLVLFMLIKHEDLRNRLIGLVGPGQVTVTTRALADAGQRISRYLLMQFVINSSYGLALGVGLFLFGVPYALLWGFLAALLRYVPYVGPWIAALFPITISLVAFPGWGQLGLVLCLFLCLELIANMIMEPWLYGQSIGVSQVGLLVVIAFWTWLWGPIGLVLATPLTVCIIVLGRHVPQLRFFDLLLGDEPALDPPVIYYQRLLARDLEEATELVEEYVQTQTLEAVYDDVLTPALLLAWHDRKQGILSPEDESFIFQATQDIVESVPFTEQENGNSDQALLNAISDPSASQALILGCPAHHGAEEIILHMLRQLMHRAGYRMEVISARTHSSDITTRINQENPALVFIATLPGGLPQTRYLCHSLRTAHPDLSIVVGYWGDKNKFDKVLSRLRQAGANYLATSLLQSRSRICALIEEAATQPETPELGRPFTAIPENALASLE